MRYVIVSVVQGEAGRFNNEIRKEVWDKLRAKSSKLPAHFTIKAPFEHEGPIDEIEGVLEEFCRHEKAEPYKIEGYGHFGDRVVYMKVNMTKAAKKVHDRLIEKLSEIPYMQFDKKDGKDKTFHVTVASKGIQPIFDKVWAYANSKPCSFDCLFDNVSIYRWEDNTWKIYKVYSLK